MNAEAQSGSFDHKAFLRSLTHRPGVYRMLDATDKVLYVGKAKDLRRRVGSYFTRSLNRRLQLLVAQIVRIEVTVTHTEAEALILENNLIKAQRPRYNVLLRDDKSYPYIYISSDQEYPRLTFHRGAKRGKGRYFGPYPSAGAVRETLQLLQRLFPVRQCEDSVFRGRSRPCLQYQIKRCSAPCVGLISREAYAEDLLHSMRLLEGKTNWVVEELVSRMEAAADALEFEQAAIYRDQIANLKRVQERQCITGERGDLDLVACVRKSGLVCIQVFYVRAGRNLGNKAFFPQAPEDTTEPFALAAFLAQYYLGRQVPPEIIVNEAPEDFALLQDVLSQESGHRVSIRRRVRGDRARWLALAETNARLALDARLASKAGMVQRLEALRDLLDLPDVPSRFECFDISHTGGEKTVAACVVFDEQGPRKADYRRFNIEGVQAGDDYAALEQALTRRYTRIQKGEGVLPDVLFIDGGKGQLNRVAAALAELGVSNLPLVGVAKGPDRRPGQEQLFLSGKKTPLILPADSPALHLIQQIRDEAHRFAITGHRQRRGKSRRTSVLEQIAGVGPKRRQRLLKQFGGLQELARAGVEDLARVAGVSRHLAQQIYDALRGEE